ncbi:MAG TPA: GMC family oxidoreductase N-terminal domain-containing protein, partial [Pilimelia sp.]|nr:GMC family oxidoreductase N-terminal domain-containing protein [Pilimelia sp.]
MTDRTLTGAYAALLGADPAEARRSADRLAGLARLFPRHIRYGLFAGLAALDAAARATTGHRLASLDAGQGEALCTVLAARPAGRQLAEALKLPMLLAAGADRPARSAGHAESARPEPPLACVPAAQWPARATADAIVVGSGAGGAMAARELARAGLRVVICEEGRRFTVADFRDRPIVDRFTALYRDGGATVALGLPPILLPLGRGVGGTTLVNSGTCYRTPDRVLRRWRDGFGVPAADPDRFGHLLDEVERTLAVAPTPVKILGRNGLLALAGAQRLGWRAAPLRRNAPGCGGCCECVVGCPRNAKYGVHLNALPQACAAGAVIVTGARVDRVLVDRAPGGRARAAGVAFGGHEILAPLVVVAAGAVETPRLLRRSGLGRHPGLG